MGSDRTLGLYLLISSFALASEGTMRCRGRAKRMNLPQNVVDGYRRGMRSGQEVADVDAENVLFSVAASMAGMSSEVTRDFIT